MLMLMLISTQFFEAIGVQPFECDEGGAAE